MFRTMRSLRTPTLVLRRAVGSEMSFQTSATTMKMKGTVKWFSDTKGYGFITPEDGGADVFVHQRNVKKDGFRSLREGETVEFETELVDGRTRAVDVTGPEGRPPMGSEYNPNRTSRSPRGERSAYDY